jgi:lipoyl(octanoyl) transferase
MQKVKVEYQDLGKISYKTAWDYQTTQQKQLIDTKIELRKAFPDRDETSVQAFEAALKRQQQHFLLMCEHNAVYTLGKSGSLEHLLLSEKDLEARQIEFFKINRGGDITFHGEGQITGYPIFDLECFFTDVHRYVRSIEEVIIRTLAEYDLEGLRIKEFTGVWLDDDVWKPKRKICAIGVHLSRWVSLHGFAFNVNTDLDYFKNIIPCGIDDADKTVTSLAQELGKPLDMNTVKIQIKKHFSDVFDCEVA